MTLKQTKQRGFTIVELLIVVVIIAILAAITIVAYNGIQDRAKKSSAQSAASSLQKKAEAYGIDGPNNYPTTVSQMTTAASDKSYYLAPASLTLQTTALVAGTAPTNANTVNYYTCNSGKGYRIVSYNFDNNTLATINGGDQSAGTCTIATS